MLSRELPKWLQFATLALLFGCTFVVQHFIKSRYEIKLWSTVTSHDHFLFVILAFVFLCLRLLFSLPPFRFSVSTEVQVAAAVVAVLLIALLTPRTMKVRESASASFVMIDRAH